MANPKDEENRTLKQLVFKRTEQLTKTINLLEDIQGRTTNVAKIPDDINKLLKEIKG